MEAAQLLAGGPRAGGEARTVPPTAAPERGGALSAYREQNPPRRRDGIWAGRCPVWERDCPQGSAVPVGTGVSPRLCCTHHRHRRPDSDTHP